MSTRQFKWFALSVSAFLMSGCASMKREAAPADPLVMAQIPGFPECRMWGDDAPMDEGARIIRLKGQIESDPDFDPKQRAFYYVRVIEIPKPRWSAYDQKRFGIKMSEDVPMTVQDRAYTSPIWYTPKG